MLYIWFCLEHNYKEMSRSMKEIVLMLELAAENDWIDAFYLPFGQNVGFKPVMGSCTQALTCLMNIRISWRGGHFANFWSYFSKKSKIQNRLDPQLNFTLVWSNSVPYEKMIKNVDPWIKIDEQSFTKLEESLVRVERLKRDFVQVDEVDKLAELVLEDSRDWSKIQQKYQELANAWKKVRLSAFFCKLQNF